ncbi:hypothetical protein BM525_19805 (plasmid) [Alteromonas mediterranea]|uniref:Uncharacterized protein n=1 Tax=Alteromonas mediterranea TaxID=314275 RepID=A0AAC9NSV4_9ALTE|nr:hypothetical protein [Alteromonas mediterranea]APD92130.1 hypothetical protein BM524_19610 [Alteromonas mediterranea]APD99984.1 hypothetical protein BM525_19805 [Alteromonas mediterranea]
MDCNEKKSQIAFLTEKALDISLNEKELAALIEQTAATINEGGIELFKAFKQNFKDFRPLSIQQLFDGTASPQDERKEVLFSSVLQKITVPPEKSKAHDLPKSLYRGCSLNPLQLRRQNGYCRLDGERSLYKHQMATGRSIYISATSKLSIACEFAMQSERRGGGGHWVYQINPINASSCNDHLSPLRFHAGESEYVFTKHLPFEQIESVAWARNCDELETDFYSIDDAHYLLRELVIKGIAKI